MNRREQERGGLHLENKVPRSGKASRRNDSAVLPLERLQKTAGNQATVSLLEAGKLQTKLRVSQPSDADEVEADRVAEEVTSGNDPSPGGLPASPALTHRQAPGTTLHRKCECHGSEKCPECEVDEGERSKGIHRKPSRDSQDIRETSDDIVQHLGPGRGLDPAVRKSMESQIGADFSGVRIHDDSRAAESARSLNARAFTLGRNIVFDSGEYTPQTRGGRKLLAHELSHVVQQRQTSPGTTANVHRRVHPEDVSAEMVGRQFGVTGPFNSGAIHLKGGESVEVVAWSNSATTATVQLPHEHAHIPFDIPKRLLRPDSPSAAGIAPYSAGISQQVRAIEKGEQAIAHEQSRKGGPRPGEIPRLQGLQQNREFALNRKLVQETMMNRFDPLIKKWVDFYNQQFGFTGQGAHTPLDPNLVKSLLFRESQMGTSGEHLETGAPGHPISHPVRSRFNVGQVIDTSASALLLMIQEMQPALITTFHLENIRHDLAAAQSEFTGLKKLPHRNAAQQARLHDLEQLSDQNWEVFLWGYKAPGQTTGFLDAVQSLFSSVGSGQPALNFDYEFWIRAAIRWIFEKRRSVKSWEEAIRAYNGSGASARHYRDAVRQRAQAAESAQSSGTEFVPSGI